MSTKLAFDPADTRENYGDLFGIFFEDINHAADGGLYAEMIRNRSFEFCGIDNRNYDNLTAWKKVEFAGRCELEIMDEGAFCDKNPHYLRINVTTPGSDVGVLNEGFNSGLNIKKDAVYNFRIYARRKPHGDMALRVALRSEAGDIYSSQDFNVTDTWQKYEMDIISPVDDTNARLSVTVLGEGEADIDFVSLFPADTYKGRKYGLRKDIAEALEELHPAFMRFPGGCLVHDGSLNPNNRDSMYRWKNTLGPEEERPARRSNWGYNQTLGLGYYEYFLFCEDIKAKPLPVIPGGCDPHHRRYEDINNLKPWIDDALDLIEFANGDETTKWGQVRIKLGHKEPFNLEYLGVGNEEVSAPFFEREPYFVKAIREKYPDIKLIGTSGPFAKGGEFDRGFNAAVRDGMDFVDEHYYMAPEWFVANASRYADKTRYKEGGPKVFLGEYATWGNDWLNALTEAAYLVEVKNNASVVGLCAYAPLLCNDAYRNWAPDMIWFNNHDLYKTPNYFVQKLFMHNCGDNRINASLTYDLTQSDFKVMSDDFAYANKEALFGGLRFETVDSDVEYTNIRIKDNENGSVELLSDIHIRKGGEPVFGKYDEVLDTFIPVESSEYEIEFDAVMNEGNRGFILRFGYLDENNFITWEVGGWQNLDNVIDKRINGRGACLEQFEFSVEKGRTYHMLLKVNKRRIQAYIDGVLYQDVCDKVPYIKPVYVNVSKDDTDIIIKYVNLLYEGEKVMVDLLNTPFANEETGRDANCMAVSEMTELSGFDDKATNNYENKECVKQKEYTINTPLPSFDIMIPKRSFVIQRIKNYCKPVE